jgi:hypothetical protein
MCSFRVYGCGDDNGDDYVIMVMGMVRVGWYGHIWYGMVPGQTYNKTYICTPIKIS